MKKSMMIEIILIAGILFFSVIVSYSFFDHVLQHYSIEKRKVNALQLQAALQRQKQHQNKLVQNQLNTEQKKNPALFQFVSATDPRAFSVAALTQLIQKSDVKIIELTPNIHTITCRITGSFFQVMQLIDACNSLPFPCEIHSLKITAINHVTLTFVLAEMT
ncbi:MAG: hypothetical protein ACD_42C00603G0001 [uncultured bacterium]|nr:MAG: hypothetical protein ACD_42C00603G0001 [uncultured bacterium]OGT25615.1 MAG: hypothetical protein A3B71_06190 [Gammaproteobacteria bacterium RIFCSPHIGHO2_02_FULL_42_43]OGT51570.1 MAG: hypothetical protein A3E54_05955 [Gammaproteobacteria bacterium RIFCSPHIGHO2_12_FULL_41_25]OGT62269.1 MAG: hypothetical protein A3I77_04890 [Gammaproteobacteria bacterium RIFCSPLOWO2_02_FULL_42_14]OGT85943.1 MAG: hypothetical protein A3G86_04580 [Gammaproteobacteria bacterium RIFCSPLOWO2_12_FULL_42_18]